MRKLKIGKDLNRTDKIYRYVSFESFIAMMESQSLNFAHVNNWEDPWEAIAGKLPTVNGQKEVVPRLLGISNIGAQTYAKAILPLGNLVRIRTEYLYYNSSR